MKKVIALLLALMMLFTIVTPVASVAYAADDNSAAVSTVEEQGEKEESKSFFEKISDFFHNIFAKIAGIFNAKCPICDKKHDDDNDTDINIGSGLDSHIHVGVTKDHSRTEATCGRNGSYTRVTTCSICGTVMNTEILTIPATGDHKYTIKGKTVRANCVEEGYTIMKCECGTAEEKITLEIDSTNHKTVVDDAAISPDCTVPGLTKGSHCEACGVVVIPQEKVDALGHTEEAIPAQDATCTATGLTEGKKCTVCGVITVEQEVVNAKGHSYNDGIITTAPKCTVEGIKTFTCEDCRHTYTEVVSALGHTAAEAVKENRVNATCTVDGSYDSVVYCSVCKAQISREKVVVKAEGHKYNTVVTAPTCTAGGYTTYTCSVCRDTYVDDEVAALNHSFTDYVSNNDATCIVDGTKTAKCDRCDVTDTVTDEGSAPGHKYDEKVTAPTCTEDGYTTHTCSTCGDKYTDSKVAATGHKASEAVTENNVDATCTTDGSYETVVYCSVCEEELSRVSVTVEALKHSFTNYVSNNNAACEVDGTKTAKCDRCDVTDTITDEGSALAHDYAEETEEATCLTPGYTTYTCKICGKGYTEKVADALGHSFTNYISNKDAECEKDGTKTAKCNRCDVTDTVTDAGSALKHNYKAVVTTEPTCTTKGLMTYTCENDANHTYTEDIAALEHIDADNNGYCDRDNVLMCNHEGIGTTLKDYKEATCTEDGYSGDKHCAKCDNIVEYGSKIDKIPHTYEAVVTAPTCTEEGYTTYTCSVCSDSYVSDPVAKNNHTEVIDEAVDATCTETGLTEGKHCDVCGKILVAQQVVDAKDHIADKAVKENEIAATCYAKGSYEEVVYCSVEKCKAELSRVEKTIDKIAHTSASAVRENEVAATCYAEGSYDEVVYCSVEECKAELSRETKTIDKIAHTPANAVYENEVAATCYAEGSYEEVVYCSVEKCKAELSRETKTIDKIAHTSASAVRENEVAATCYAEGSYEEVVYCSVEKCKAVLSRETKTIDKIAHTPGEEKIENNVNATCIKEGSYDTVVYCTVEKCGAELSRETTTTEKVDHSFTNYTYNNDATCSADGTETATCNTEGCNKTDKKTKAGTKLSHTEVIDEAVEATCTATGLTEGKHCSVCNEVLVEQETVAVIAHRYNNGVCTVCGAIEIKTNFTGDFLYRVGNQNAVALGSLFAAKDGSAIDSSKVSVTVETLNGTAASGKYTANTTDWTKGTIKFEGTGVVKVTIQQNSVSCELILEVVDAKNITKAESATANNVVLLNDISGTFVVSGGYTFYGNGFTVTLPTTSVKNKGQGYTGYISVGAAQDDGIANGGNLDNVRIEGPVYPEMYIYRSQAEITNKSDPDYGDGYNMRYFTNSVIVYGGNCTISNCYISGSRTALCLRGGNNVVIENTTLSGGSYANLEICAGSTVTLCDLTTVQVDVADSYGKGKTMHGMGIAVASGVVDIYIEGELNQYNWLNEEAYDKIVPSAYQSFFPKFFDDNNFSKYWHYYGDETLPYVNLAFIFACNWDKSKIHDDKSNKDYETCDTSITGSDGTVAGGVYTKVNTVGGKAIVDADLAGPEYVSTGYNPVAPVLNFVDYGYEEDDANDANDSYCVYNESTGTLKLGINGDSKTLDLSKVSVSKDGTILTHTAYLNGTKITENPITINAADGAKQTLTFKASSSNAGYDKNGNAIEGSIEYTWNITVEVATLAYPAPEWNMGGVYKFDATTNCVFVEYNYDYGEAVPIYEGIKVKYYDKNGKLVEKDFSGTTSIPTGSNNANANVFTYTLSDGSTLVMKYSSGWKSGATTHQFVKYDSKVYIYPQSLDNGNYARNDKTAQDFDVKISYTFTDPNGQSTSTQTMQWYNAKANNNKVKEVQWKTFDGGNGKTPTTCFTPETLITLADGSQKRIDELSLDDKILAWDFFAGEYAEKNISLLVNHGYDYYDIANMKFSDGTELRIVGIHGVFDYDLNEFVYITPDNVTDFIGHRFVQQNTNGGYNLVTLVDGYATTEYTGSYSVSSSVTSNAFASGLLTVAPPQDFYNWIEMSGKLQYDTEQFAKDVETYGLYTYEDFADYVTYEQFEAFNGAYLKIPVEKGLFTFDYIIELIDLYVSYMPT